jgi:hypothetical protein
VFIFSALLLFVPLSFSDRLEIKGNQGVRLLEILTNLDPVGRRPTEYDQGV